MSAEAAVVLRKARALLEKPEHWTQGMMARGKSGRRIFYGSRSAVCWCADGAIWRAANGSLISRKGWVANAAEQYLSAATGRRVSAFNDAPERTHAEVLAAFDRAIALAEAANV